MTTIVASSAATWRPGQLQDWPVATSLDDPVLGLTYEQLTESWEPLGLPDNWSPEMARTYAEATHAVISRAIGNHTGRRTNWGHRARAIAGVVLTEPADDEREAAFDEFGRHWLAFLDDKSWGWGTGEGA